MLITDTNPTNKQSVLPDEIQQQQIMEQAQKQEQLDHMMSMGMGDEAFARQVTEYLMELPQGQEVLDTQHDRWARAMPGHARWAEAASQCQKFLEGEQWTTEELQTFEEEGRPSVTLNNIKPLIFLVLGFYRQNRYESKVFPTNKTSSDEEVAQLLTMQLKQIYEANHSAWKDSAVFQDGITTGRGFWDNRLDFEDNRNGEVREVTKDPFSIVIDPEAESYDPSDKEGGWQYVFESRWMSPTEIYLLFGANAADAVMGTQHFFPLQDNISDEFMYEHHIYADKTFGLEILEHEWRQGVSGQYTAAAHHINRHRKLIRVLECQHKELKLVKYLIDPVTGEELILDDSIDNEKIARIIEFSRLSGLGELQVGRDIKRMVRWTVTAADRVLYDKWSPYGQHYTLTPYFPYFRRGITRGMIHDLIDPQKEINRRRSARLHAVMTAVNGGWMWEKGSLDDENRETLELMGSRPGVTLEYETGQKPPIRIESSPTPYAQKELEVDSAQDLKYIANINDSALGQIDKVQSGRAILARQQQAMVGTEIYFDNFRYSREIKARGQIYMVQRYYTEERLIKLRNVDGDMEQYVINQRAAGKIINDISYGSFDVAVDETPSSQTHLAAQFNELFDLWTNGMPIPPDILIKHSSVGGKQEILQRMQQQMDLDMNMALMENIIQRLQMGIALDQPLPPVVVNGREIPSVVTPEILNQLMMSMQAHRGPAQQQMQAQKPQQSPSSASTRAAEAGVM